MFRMHVVAQENGATGAHRGVSKENGSGIDGHGEGRSGPKTNEEVDGPISRETDEANEIDDSRSRKTTEDTRRNDRAER